MGETLVEVFGEETVFGGLCGGSTVDFWQLACPVWRGCGILGSLLVSTASVRVWSRYLVCESIWRTAFGLGTRRPPRTRHGCSCAVIFFPVRLEQVLRISPPVRLGSRLGVV
jgi:hypothetical protein